MLRYGRYDQPATYLLKQLYNDENKDISNPFEVTERKTLAVENIVDKNKYLTILCSVSITPIMDICQKYYPYSSLQCLHYQHIDV